MLGLNKAESIITVLNQTEANVLCLQECGDLGELLQGRSPLINAAGATAGHTGNFVVGRGFYECVFWEGNTPRLGLAILNNVGTQECGILPAAPLPAPAPAFRDIRNLPWIRVAHPALGNIYIYTIHAPPVTPPGVPGPQFTVAQVVAWVNAQIASIRALHVNGGQWVCLGDYNVDPSEFPPVAGGPRVVHGNRATIQGGSKYDYAITNIPNFRFFAATNLCGASDHYPQAFEC
ncbi:MAG: hypothetical protein ACLP7Q_16125 [Isosphaeraceae bacterium]